MPNLNYQIHLDSNRDGTFSGVNDDITAYVRQAEWRYGMDSPRGQVSPPAQANLLLNNSDGAFDLSGQGAECLSNGNFAAWTSGVPDNWTLVSAAPPNATLTQTAPDESYGGSGFGAANFYRTAGTNLRLRQTALTVGKTYRASINITAQGAGNSGGVSVVNGAQSSPIFSTIGLKTWLFTASSADFDLLSRYVVDTTLDSASVVEVRRYAGVQVGDVLRISSPSAYGLGTPPARTVFWLGRVKSLTRLDAQTVKLTAECPLAALATHDYLPPFLLNTTSSAALTRLAQTWALTWPHSSTAWVIEDEAGGRLDVSAALSADPSTYTAYDAGEAAFAYLGAVNGADAVSPLAYIQSILAAELGRYFWDARAARLVFHARHHDSLAPAVSLTLDSDAYTVLDMAYADEVYNAVTVLYQARQVGAAGSVIWQLMSLPLRLRPGESRTLTAPYSDVLGDGQAVNILEGIIPLREVDFRVTVDKFGVGQSRTERVMMAVEFGAAQARITLTHDALEDVYIQFAQLRGTPLFAQAGRVSLQDPASIRQFNRLQMPVLAIPALDNDQDAQALAAYTLSINKTPAYYARRVGLVAGVNSTTANAVFGVSIGTRLRLLDTPHAYDQDAILVGEQHRLDGATLLHQAEWLLRPVGRERFWRLETVGYGELGVNTLAAL